MAVTISMQVQAYMTELAYQIPLIARISNKILITS